MAKPINLDEIVRKHPNLNVEQVQKALELLDELRKAGVVPVARSGTTLIRRRVRLMDDLDSDPRVVRLRST